MGTLRNIRRKIQAERYRFTDHARGEMQDEMCEYCEGKLFPKTVTITHRWKGKFVVIENVPVLVCQLCGERYFDARVMKKIERIARSKSTPSRILQVPVRLYSHITA
jgi:YgiT-type zinc finger domain-containing protein